jgi:chromate reductase
LKNAIDWASRPPDQPFAGEPVAIIGASAGMSGTARAQYDLRRSCVFLDMHPVNRPEVLIGQANTKLDAAGRLTDEAGRGFIRDLLIALEQWTRLIGRKS